MDAAKKKRLEAKGYRFMDVDEFLGLTPEEMTYIDLKIDLKNQLKAARLDQNMTQAKLATLIGSSQSRVAKMETADPTVSIDLLVRTLIALGATKFSIDGMTL